MREIGVVKAVQVQRASLKVGEKSNRTYNPAALMMVDALHLSPEGVIGLLIDGDQIVDVHHANHPDTKYRGENGVSVGFTSHYAAMRQQFGTHLVDRIAGENILVAASRPYSLADLGTQMAFQNPETEEFVLLDELCVADPCEPFSRFVLRQSAPVEAAVMKATLQFLGDGIRGFYAVGNNGVVQAGDRVWVA